MLVGQDQLGKNSPSFMEKQMQTLSIQEGVHSHSFMGKKNAKFGYTLSIQEEFLTYCKRIYSVGQATSTTELHLLLTKRMQL